MRVVYRGNFGVPFSTESHVAWSMEDMGVDVVRLQEDEVDWATTERACRNADLFLFTQTYGFACRWERKDAYAAMHHIGERIPTAGFHLDKWWGLAREWQVHREADEPFFMGLQHLFTADGDHDMQWSNEGINHHWSPPAVFGRECWPGQFRPEFCNDIIFVGSWRDYAHEEWWSQRKAMLDYVHARYQYGFSTWPKRQAVRGQNLNDLYASARVVVGDSCLATISHRYFSDRAFETVGRGGFLITPYVSGLAEMLIDGVHCRFYDSGDFDQLSTLIDHYLAHEDERISIAQAGQAHVRAHHTYGNRMADVFRTLGLGQ